MERRTRDQILEEISTQISPQWEASLVDCRFKRLLLELLVDIREEFTEICIVLENNLEKL